MEFYQFSREFTPDGAKNLYGSVAVDNDRFGYAFIKSVIGTNAANDRYDRPRYSIKFNR